MAVASRCPRCRSSDIQVYTPTHGISRLGGHYGGDFASCNECGHNSGYYIYSDTIHRSKFKKALKEGRI
jgi:hypothetical protein